MARPSRRSPTFRTAAERLERRDCPAAITIAGSRDLGEAAGFTDLTVRLSAADRAPVSVDYFLSGDASYGRDYQLAIGTSRLPGPTGTITFRPGETTKTIRMTIVNDIDREVTERMGITLFRPRNATLGAATSAAVTIADDDSYTARIVAVGSTTIAEGAAGNFEVRLSSPATRTESFYVSTKSAEAQSGADFRPLTKLPLIFRPGESSKRFTVQTVRDADANEYSEVFFVAAESTTAGFPRIDDLAVTIAGQGPAPQPGVSIADASVAEAGPGVVTPLAFRITLTHAFRLPVTVAYATADGSATLADSDYRNTSGLVTIPAGETSATVTVLVVGDARVEPNETFSIVLSAPVNGTIADGVGIGTILNDDQEPTSAFQIVVTFPDTSLTPQRQAVFQRAAARWAEIITVDLPDQVVGGRTIDDVEISARAPFIDGPGRILGQAGPTALRTTGTLLPYLGEMEFDSADVAQMERDGTFADVILHEMGHVLGLGVLWDNLVTGAGTSNPVYVGMNALREYRTLSGNAAATGVPVENTGGQGTRDSHWRDSVFGAELMTGYAEPAGVRMPISRLTVGALEDLGYGVNYAAADSYTMPRLRDLSSGTSTRSPATGRAANRALLFAALDPALSMFHAFAEHGRDSTTSRGAFRRLTPVWERLADVTPS